jgi:5-hydroxyisourate hydrolase
MPGVSVHVVDVSRGIVATGMQVEFYALMPERKLLAAGKLSETGLLEASALEEHLARGTYEAVFHVGAWYRIEGVNLPEVPFLDTVAYRFGIDDPTQHYHLPFKCTPWGYSCFRGGK